MTTIEVPHNPERIAVLDMAVLDMLDAWGVGDKVVGNAERFKNRLFDGLQ